MKTLADQLRNAVSILQKEKIRFALAGGLIASLYRKQERMTKDLDLLFFAEGRIVDKAFFVLEKLGLEPNPIRMAQLAGGTMHSIKNKTSEVAMVCGLPPKDSGAIQVDFLLPIIPWFESALFRSEKNLVDFGFGKIPCLTVEDVILSKLFAFENQTTRFKDLDDLQSIFQSGIQLDLNYLSDKFEMWKLKLPVALGAEVPAVLRKLEKGRKGT